MNHFRRPFFCFLLICASLVVSTICPSSSAEADSLRQGFVQPPQSAKLRCYWWWLNGNTNEETITHDLEEMKSHGFAGAILVDADGSGQSGNAEVPAGPAIGSAKWVALFVHALDVAQKLGLEISLNVTSRWDVGIIGGRTVIPEDAMKMLTYSRTTVQGGGSRTLRLTQRASLRFGTPGLFRL
jgi:hypothetical protein